MVFLSSSSRVKVVSVVEVVDVVIAGYNRAHELLFLGMKNSLKTMMKT